MIEYAMAFHNLEGVRSVQRARAQRQANEDNELVDIFAEQVKNLFGRDINYQDILEAREDAAHANPVFSDVEKTNSAPQEEALADQLDEISIAPSVSKTRDAIKQQIKDMNKR